MKRRWTHIEDVRLELLWCETDIVDIAKQLRRSVCAVRHRSRYLKLPTRSVYLTLREAARSTGYAITTIQLALHELKIRRRPKPRVSCWRANRVGRRSRDYGISEDELERVVVWLKAQPTWRAARTHSKRVAVGCWGIGTKPEQCIRCGTADRPHRARGMCTRCLQRFYEQRRRQ